MQLGRLALEAATLAGFVPDWWPRRSLSASHLGAEQPRPAVGRVARPRDKRTLEPREAGWREPWRYQDVQHTAVALATRSCERPGTATSAPESTTLSLSLPLLSISRSSSL